MTKTGSTHGLVRLFLPYCVLLENSVLMCAHVLRGEKLDS